MRSRRLIVSLILPLFVLSACTQMSASDELANSGYPSRASVEEVPIDDYPIVMSIGDNIAPFERNNLYDTFFLFISPDARPLLVPRLRQTHVQGADARFLWDDHGFAAVDTRGFVWQNKTLDVVGMVSRHEETGYPWAGLFRMPDSSFVDLYVDNRERLYVEYAGENMLRREPLGSSRGVSGFVSCGDRFFTYGVTEPEWGDGKDGNAGETPALKPAQLVIREIGGASQEYAVPAVLDNIGSVVGTCEASHIMMSVEYEDSQEAYPQGRTTGTYVPLDFDYSAYVQDNTEFFWTLSTLETIDIETGERQIRPCADTDGLAGGRTMSHIWSAHDSGGLRAYGVDDANGGVYLLDFSEGTRASFAEPIVDAESEKTVYAWGANKDYVVFIVRDNSNHRAGYVMISLHDASVKREVYSEELDEILGMAEAWNMEIAVSPQLK